MDANQTPVPCDEETRCASRMRLAITVKYSFNATSAPDDTSVYRQGTILDISERGLCFKAVDYFCVQRIISVYLKLSDHTRGIKMLAKTIWTAIDPDGSMRVGMQFIGTLPSDWQRIVAMDRKPD